MKQITILLSLLLVILLSSFVSSQVIYDEFSLNQYKQPVEPTIDNTFAVTLYEQPAQHIQPAEPTIYNQFDITQQQVPQPAPAPKQAVVFNQFSVDQPVVIHAAPEQETVFYNQFTVTQPTVPQPAPTPVNYDQFTVTQQAVIQPAPTPVNYDQFTVTQQAVPQPTSEPVFYNRFSVTQPAPVPRPVIEVEEQPVFYNQFEVEQTAPAPQPAQQIEVVVFEPVTKETFLVEREQEAQPAPQPESQPEVIYIQQPEPQQKETFLVEQSRPAQAAPQPTSNNEFQIIQHTTQPITTVPSNEQIVVIQSNTPIIVQSTPEIVIVETQEVVNQTFDFDIYADERDINIYACSPYTERIVVHNTGSTSQTFTVIVENNKLSEWTTISPETFTLPANEAQEIFVTINTPCDYDGYQAYDLRVETQESTKTFERGLGVFLQQNLDVVVFDVNRTSCPCIAQVYNYTIANIGTFTETYTLSTSDFEENIDFVYDEITLAPNQTYSGSFSVKYDCDVYGNKDFDLYIETERTSLIGTIPISYTIDACYDYTLSAPEMTVCDNGEAQYELLIESQSDVELEIDLESMVPDYVVVDFNYIQLPPRGNVSIPVSLKPEFAGEESLNVTFTSTERYANFVATQSTQLNVTQCYAYESQTSYEAYDICPIEHLFPITVTNNGEYEEEFLINIAVAEEYTNALTLEKNNVTLLPAETQTVLVYINGSQLKPNKKIPVTIQTQFVSTSLLNQETEVVLQTRDTEHCFGIVVSPQRIVTNNTPTQFDFSVTNVGILNATYELASWGPQWVTLSNNTITLASGETKIISYNIGPDSNVTNTSYPFAVFADTYNIRQVEEFEVDVNPDNSILYITLAIVAALLLALLVLTFLPTIFPLVLLGLLIAGIAMIPACVDYDPATQNETRINFTEITDLIGGEQNGPEEEPESEETEDEVEEEVEEEEEPVDEIVFCANDLFTCEDGTNVTRDHKNNCEFESCPVDRFAWIKNLFTKESICADDTLECSEGVFVIRNENDECAFYSCPGDTYYYNETVSVTVINKADDTVYYESRSLTDRISDWLSTSNSSCSKDMFECAPGIYSIRSEGENCAFHLCPGDVYYYNETIAFFSNNESIKDKYELQRFVTALDNKSRVIYVEPNGTATIDLHGYFIDPDGDSLTYSINTSNVDNYVLIMEDNYVTVIPSTDYTGVERITITATDGDLETTSPNLYLATVPKEWWPENANSESDSSLDKRMIILLVILLVIIFAIIIYMDVSMLKKNAK